MYRNAADCQAVPRCDRPKSNRRHKRMNTCAGMSPNWPVREVSVQTRKVCSALSGVGLAPVDVAICAEQTPVTQMHCVVLRDARLWNGPVSPATESPSAAHPGMLQNYRVS